ncbi:IclR family transcriptional regulator [Planktotalea arctica]|uniref:IclR family transcriptional regulator n=1 Tax=Planktotalea arctica TaxID=1481893 RepID=UPI000A1759A6|nr:IclR family transcriptional regulator [Planktotalea arctica]
MSETFEKDRRFASTLARGLSVLRAFRASDDGLSHMEIAERTGLPNATVSRLTFTLRELGYLSHAGKNDRYRLGPAALAIGNVASASVSFLETASDPMQKLANETGTLALFAVRDGEKMLLVKTWRPQNTASIWLEPGHRIPIFGSSSGMAVMACLSDAAFAALEPDDDLRSFRQTGYEQLLARGFAVAPNDTRYAASVNAVSVPFHAGEFGEPASFSCGALPEMLGDARMEEDVGPKLRDAVRALETRTGRSPALLKRG